MQVPKAPDWRWLLPKKLTKFEAQSRWCIWNLCWWYCCTPYVYYFCNWTSPNWHESPSKNIYAAAQGTPWTSCHFLRPQGDSGGCRFSIASALCQKHLANWTCSIHAVEMLKHHGKKTFIHLDPTFWERKVEVSLALWYMHHKGLRCLRHTFSWTCNLTRSKKTLATFKF